MAELAAQKASENDQMREKKNACGIKLQKESRKELKVGRNNNNDEVISQE